MNMSIHSVISLQHPGEDNESIKTLYENMLKSLEHLMEGLMQSQIEPCGLQEMVYVVCMEFNFDELISLIHKLCENIGSTDLPHDKATVTRIGTLLAAEILDAILVYLPMVDHLEVWLLLIEGISCWHTTTRRLSSHHS
ncbi:Maestro heat-like repeat-containing protein family member 2A [Sciurus carolinensis]|uniref:Maestro heat-like repeat-containing protein family member 2A n=1 Tax=Sciurus carolinensis TaxID=30640 RepID=A0AA41MHG0_SCICA|nr:Maestro heat-like repeat-containing protein family member 2A [Sciurus carolinensis]